MSTQQALTKAYYEILWSAAGQHNVARTVVKRLLESCLREPFQPKKSAVMN